jgi:hypothetical protein
MTDAIRKEIERIEESATRLKELAGENRAVAGNAEIILTYVYLLKFITPEPEGGVEGS